MDKCLILVIFCVLKSLIVQAAPSMGGMIPLIVNGSDVRNSSLEYMVAIYSDTTSICSGTLISDRLVLTAAHCISPKEDGTEKGDFFGYVKARDQILTIEFQEAYCYPGNSTFCFKDKYEKDLAVLITKEPVPLSYGLRPVCLAANDNLLGDNGQKMVAIGFGQINDAGNSPPQYALVEKSECKDNDSSKFCIETSSSKICEGDSGGPIILRGFSWSVQVGIISSGFVTVATDVCSTNAISVNVIGCNRYIEEIANRFESSQVCFA